MIIVVLLIIYSKIFIILTGTNKESSYCSKIRSKRKGLFCSSILL